MDIPTLLQPYIEGGLSGLQFAQVSTYLDLLLRWNQKTNLTAIRDPQQIVTRHFGESFFLAGTLFGSESLQLPDVLDLGSGAGFPAIPLLIYRPSVTITLVEAHHTKAVFLREVLRALQLHAEVRNVRAETLPDASAAIVTLRAVEKFDSILPTAARLVRTAERNIGASVRLSVDCEGPFNGHGLALLVSSTQVPRAQQLLPNWRFLPPVPIPKSQNRVIQLAEPS